MPKRVDRQARRTLIADALMRVAAEQGLEAVSLRHVAAAAGVSAGMVQHYFSTKDEMMAFALEVVRERGQARVTTAMAGLGDDASPRRQLRTMIAALLPLDDRSRDDGRVALAFLAYTAVRPAAGAGLRADSAELIKFIATLLPPVGDPPGPDLDAAAGLLALMEGLALYLLSGNFTGERALRLLDAQLNRLFGPATG
jgi:AcrR family transcriptional regulator